MAKEVINIGSAPNDGTGDSAREAGAKINANFTELYTRVETVESDVGNIEYGSLLNAPILGSAASRDVGFTTGNLVALDGPNRLPPLDGSQLVNLPGGGGGGGSGIQTQGVPTAGQATRWVNSNTVEGYDLTSSEIDGLGTAAERNVGTSVGNVVEVLADGKLPVLDGSNLTNISGGGGTGLPAGGDVGQILTKVGVDDGDAAWQDSTGGVPVSRAINTGTGLLGGDTLENDITLELDAGIFTSLEKADNALANTPLAFREAFEVAIDDATEGPLIGDAVIDSMTTGVAADVLGRLNEIAIGAEVSMVLVPYVGGVPQNITQRGIPIIESNLDTNIWEASFSELTEVEQPSNSFPITDGNGEVIFAPPSAAFSLLETGRPFVSRVVPISGSNTLTLDLNNGRKIISSTPTANFTLAASSWNNLNENMEEGQLIIPSGATGYTMDVEIGGNGLYRYGATFPLTLTANTRAKFQIGKEDGNVPTITYLGSGTVATSVPSFITNTYGTAATPTMPTHAVGDLLVMHQIYFGGATPPTLAVDWTDSGLTQDTAAPQSRVSYRIATSTSTPAPTLVGTTKWYIFVYRKTVGSPAFGPITVWESSNNTAGDAQWNALTLTQKSIVTGVHTTVGADTGALRADLTIVGSPDPAAGTNRTYAGTSVLQNTGTWPSNTSTKTGNAARNATIQWAVY